MRENVAIFASEITPNNNLLISLKDIIVALKFCTPCTMYISNAQDLHGMRNVLTSIIFRTKTKLLQDEQGRYLISLNEYQKFLKFSKSIILTVSKIIFWRDCQYFTVNILY